MAQRRAEINTGTKEHPLTGAVIISEDEKHRVVAMYIRGEFAWTTTYVLDDSGEVDESVRVMANGKVYRW